MADADEDVTIPISKPSASTTSTSHAAPSLRNTVNDPAADDGSDSDDGDVGQDYRLLAATAASNPAALLSDQLDSTLSSSTVTSIATTSGAIPKRGLKDFEPDPTNHQANQLESSRLAMHTALTHIRTHVPEIPSSSSSKVASAPAGREEKWKRLIDSNSQPIGELDRATGRVLVRKTKGMGNLWTTLGTDVRGGGVLLWPEEALWGVERGSLDIQMECDGVRDEEGEDEDNIFIPMSLQSAYASLIANSDDRRNGSDLTIEKYVVFASLRRLGYIVRRWEPEGEEERQLEDDRKFKGRSMEGHKQQQNDRTAQSKDPKQAPHLSDYRSPQLSSGFKSFVTRTKNRISYYLFKFVFRLFGLSSWITGLNGRMYPEYQIEPLKDRRSRLTAGPMIHPGLYWRSWSKAFNFLFDFICLQFLCAISSLKPATGCP